MRISADNIFADKAFLESESLLPASQGSRRDSHSSTGSAGSAVLAPAPTSSGLGGFCALFVGRRTRSSSLSLHDACCEGNLDIVRAAFKGLSKEKAKALANQADSQSKPPLAYVVNYAISNSSNSEAIKRAGELADILIKAGAEIHYKNAACTKVSLAEMAMKSGLEDLAALMVSGYETEEYDPQPIKDEELNHRRPISVR